MLKQVRGEGWFLEGGQFLVTGWYVGKEPFPIKRMQSSVCGMWEGI